MSYQPIREHLVENPIIPVLAIENLEDAIPLAAALIENGLRSLEITLRTAVALEVIATLRRQFPKATIGVGTLVQPGQVEAALQAGAQYGVSPGNTPALLSAVPQNWPFLPGVATPSEAMTCLQAGFSTQKFFPAEALGGVPYLKSLAGPLPEIKFCATGGIKPTNLQDYKKCTSVLAVGGSWMVPKDLVAKQDWLSIGALAQAAHQLWRG